MSGLIGNISVGALLNQGYWRGVPFRVEQDSIRVGRKWAWHNYPFRDGARPEDMGKAPRVYSFTGYLIGSTAGLLRDVFMLACERKDTGLLIHPSVGAVTVALSGCVTVSSKDRLGTVALALEFTEAQDQLFPAIVGIALQLVGGLIQAATAANAIDLSGHASGPLAAGSAPVGEAVLTSNKLTNAAAAAVSGPLPMQHAVAALPGNFGRFANGAASVPQPATATVDTVIATITAARADVATAAATASLQAGQLAGGSMAAVSAYTGALASLMTAVQAVFQDPADQVGALGSLATFAPAQDAIGSPGIGADMVTVQAAIAAAARRAALAQLAQASAGYAPSSYEDAAAVRGYIAGLFDAEITAAADVGDDASYQALRDLRASVVQDLTARGASLAHVVTVTFPQSMPALWVSHRLYQDARRVPDVIARAGAPHPAFLPTSMQLLAQ